MIRLRSVCRSLQRVVVAAVGMCLLISVGGCSQEQLWMKVAQESAIGDTPHLKPYPAHLIFCKRMVQLRKNSLGELIE